MMEILKKIFSCKSTNLANNDSLAVSGSKKSPKYASSEITRIFFSFNENSLEQREKV